MYLSYEQVATVAATRTVADLTIPPNATHCELQADTQPTRYTMDNGAVVPTQVVGMVIAVADMPKTFLIEDLRRINFVRGGGGDGNLNIHYFAGRDI